MMTFAPWFLAMLATAPVPPPAAVCTVEGRPRHLEAQVPVARGAPFGIALDGLPVSVALADTAATIHVRSPLAFDATLAPSALPLRTRRVWRGDAGFLTLGPRSRLVAETTSGAELALHVDLEAANIHIPAVRVKCVDLTLGDTRELSPKHRIAPSARRMIPTGETLPLRSAPNAASPAWTLRFGSGSGLQLERIAARAGWNKVSASWSDGTRVTGWTEAANVQWFDGEYGDFLTGVGAGLCGIVVSGQYHGPAILHGGASVHASADGPTWARAAQTTRVVVVGNAGWVQLVEVPGLGSSNGCARLENAYVRAADLTYPP